MNEIRNKVAKRAVKATSVLALLLASKLVVNLKKALRLSIKNETKEVLQCWIGCHHALDCIVLTDFSPGQEQMLNLKNLPLVEHDVIYIRMAAKGQGNEFKRILLYDVDELKSNMKAYIVDYGNHNLDIKVVRKF